MKINERVNLQIKNKKTVKEVTVFLLSFLAPLALAVMIFGGKGISYNGMVTPFTYDMKAQYAAFFAYLRYIVQGEMSPLFSWNVSLGGNFLGLLAYYMSSPLSWITVLFELRDLPNAVYVLTMLKIGLCGLSFSAFLRFGINKEKTSFLNVVFACCYALMSYNMMYSMCLMWMDGLIFLPLVLLGIEKLLEGKKGFVYFISITGLFISNYYTSYMVGIFAAAYILCRVLSVISKENYKEQFKVLLRFGLNTLLGLGVSMPLLLPAILNIMMGKGQLAAEELTKEAGTYEFTVFELLKKLLPQQYDTIESHGLPSIYCGTVICILALLFFVHKKIKVRDKVLSLLLVMVPFSGFLFEKMDYAWHAFKYPNDFPYRYAFLFSAVLLILAYKSLMQISINTSMSRMLVVFGVCYTCMELFLNGSVMIGELNKECVYSVRSEYEKFYEMYSPLAEKIKEDDGLYRMDSAETYYSLNDAMTFGLNGVTHFSSTFNDSVNDFLRSMGCLDAYIFTSGKGLTPLMDSLLGVKYRISEKELNPAYEPIDSSQVGMSKLVLYQNPNVLSLGVLVDYEILSAARNTMEDPFYNQNLFLETLGGEKVFEKIDYNKTIEKEKEDITLEFEATDTNPVYLYVNGYPDTSDDVTGDGETNLVKIYVNGDLIENADWTNARKNIELGTFEKGEKISVRIEGRYEVYHGELLYRLNMDKFRTEMEKLKNRQVMLKSENGQKVEADISAQEGEILFTTIPYDEGFDIKIDGEEAVGGVVMNTFLVIPVPAGEHHIEIVYTPPGLQMGMTVGLITLMLAVFYYLKRNKDKLMLQKSMVSIAQNENKV